MIFKTIKVALSIRKIYSNNIKKMTKREKPQWIEPINDTELPPLLLYNSLTNRKDLFKPMDAKRVEWYSCGPTVYDVSHMGHARTYISIDIIRRIMRDYFKFDVHYVMNITDIDDKIIRRARQNHLFDKYLTEESSDALTDLKAVLSHCEKVISTEKDADKLIMLKKEKDGVENLLKKPTIERGSLGDIRDAVCSWLDKNRGHEVNDNSIFESLPRKFEDMFHEDMLALNILPPDELTRVSEFIKEIVAFVTRIIDRGFAYESNGSVYFDTERFDGDSDHYYAKLVPTAYGNEVLLQEGEGVLSTENTEKRCRTDFALWKASRPGEPSWASPWGRGRPGWHIECSAMAGSRCGPKLDLHSGGVDLKFPHHDNELAQSEAHYDGCHQWVNYFLHTGHLTISGCKMSKSLKNFVSVRDALSRWSWRQLRVSFLLSGWRETLDYSDEAMAAARSYERMLLDYLFNVRCVVVSGGGGCGDCDDGVDSGLGAALEEGRTRVHAALCDSMDTPQCMAALRAIVEAGNRHLLAARGVDTAGVVAIARYVVEMLAIFGATDSGVTADGLDMVFYDDASLRTVLTAAVAMAGTFRRRLLESCPATDKDQVALIETAFGDFQTQCSDAGDSRSELDAVLLALAQMRQQVRAAARANRWLPLLAVCDAMRDDWLVAAGVRLQDRDHDGQAPAVGLYPTWAMREDALATAAKGKTSGGGSKAKPKPKKVAVDVAPEMMFKHGEYADQFSSYDAEGVPTHLSDGSELSKTRRGKLKKLQGEHARKYAASLC